MKWLLAAQVAENLQRVDAFCQAFDSLPFDDEAAAHYGVIRSQLGREGRPIGANDHDRCDCAGVRADARHAQTWTNSAVCRG